MNNLIELNMCIQGVEQNMCIQGDDFFRCHGSKYGTGLSSTCDGFVKNRSGLSGARRGAFQKHGKHFSDTCNGFPKPYALNPEQNLHM